MEQPQRTQIDKAYESFMRILAVKELVVIAAGGFRLTGLKSFSGDPGEPLSDGLWFARGNSRRNDYFNVRSFRQSNRPSGTENPSLVHSVNGSCHWRSPSTKALRDRVIFTILDTTLQSGMKV